MSETKIACCGKIPECPNVNSRCISRHIVFPVNSIDEHSLNNLGITRETAKEMLETTAVFYKCSCGLIFRATNDGKTIIMQKFEMQ